MIASLAALGTGHAPELSGPENDRIVQHSALLQVRDERGGSTRHAVGQRAVIAADVLMRVPVAAGEGVVVAAPNLHKAHAPLQQTASGQALLGEVPRFLIGIDFRRPGFGAAVEAVEFEDVLGLGLEVEGIGRG